MHVVQDVIEENLGSKRKSERHVCLLLPLKSGAFGKDLQKSLCLPLPPHFNVFGLVNVCYIYNASKFIKTLWKMELKIFLCLWF